MLNRITLLGEIKFSCNAMTITPSDKLLLAWSDEESALHLKVTVDGSERVGHLSQEFPIDVFQAVQSLHRSGVVTLTGKQISTGCEPPGIAVEFGLTERAFSGETHPTDTGGRNPYGKRLKHLLGFLYADAGETFWLCVMCM